jgi:hypothetical protein
MRKLLLSVCGLAALLTSAAAQQKAANDIEVDLELVLAVDISWSMDAAEQRLQREGYIAAFSDPETLQAIRGGALGRIAVTYVEWAGASIQSVVVPWRLLDDRDDIDRFLAELATAPLQRRQRTSISGVVQAAMPMLDNNGYRGLRRVIDVSGDGPNNQGIVVTEARDAAVAADITINGLPLLLSRGGPSQFNIDDLQGYYVDCVIGGVGAFSIPIRNRDEFVPATRQKILREIAGYDPLLPAIVPVVDKPKSDCLIGEKLWQLRNWNDR